MLTVRDIMQHAVLTVEPGTTVRDLTRLLSEQGISGVPVLGPAGAVVGVVSSTDVVRLAAQEAEIRLSGSHWLPPAPRGPWKEDAGEDAEEEEGTLTGYFLPEDTPLLESWWEERLGDEALGEFTVEDIMTPVSFSIGPEATVKELADFLVRGRIHRAVVSEGGHLLGIVTTMDVLRAVANGGSDELRG